MQSIIPWQVRGSNAQACLNRLETDDEKTVTTSMRFGNELNDCLRCQQ